MQGGPPDGKGSAARCDAPGGRSPLPHLARRSSVVRALGDALVRRERAAGDLRRALGPVDSLARHPGRPAGRTMSSVGLFLVGLFVTLIVCSAIGVLIYGAILDGRDDVLRKTSDLHGTEPDG